VLKILLDWLRHQARKRRWSADQATGRRGEDLAHRFLRKQGYVIISRNYRARSGSGEIDLIAREGATLVFVEVKTRHSAEFGAPERAIGEEKQQALFRTAREFCRRANVDITQARFDTISIVLNRPPEIRHINNLPWHTSHLPIHN
jgi:putative endonuclease